MKKFNISAIFTTKDKISKPVKKISQSITGLGNNVTKTSLKVKSFGTLSPFKRMSFGVKNLNSNMGDLKNSITGVGSSLLALAAIGGIGNIIGNNIDNIKGLGDLANNIGADVENLSLVQAAAKTVGLEGEQFRAAMADQNRRKQDALAVEPGKENNITKAFSQLGINRKDLSSKTNAEIMDMIANGLSKIQKTNKSLASKIAETVFGEESGQKMNVLLKDGAKGLKKMKDEARKGGAVITEEDVKNATIFKKNLDNLKNSFTGLVTSITKDLLPGLASFVKNIKEWGNNNKELMKTILKIVGGAALLTGALVVLKSVLGVVGTAVKFLGSTFATVGRIFLLNPIGLAITAIVGGAYLLYKTWEPATKFFDNIFGSIGKRFEKFQELFKTEGLLDSLMGAFDGLGTEMFQPFIDGFNNFKNYFTTEFPFLSKFISGYVDVVKSVWSGLFGVMSSVVSNVFSFFTDNADTATDVVSSMFKVFGLAIHAVFTTIEAIFKGFTLLFTGDWLTDVADNWTITLDSIKDSFSGMFNFISDKYEKVKGIISAVTGFLGGDDKKETKETKVPATGFSTNPVKNSVFSGINKPADSPLANFNKPSTNSGILGPQKIESKNQIDVNITDSRVNVETSTPASKQTKTVFNVGQNRIGGLANAF